MSANNNNTSTLQSYVDSATGYVQSGIAAVTGSAGDKVCSSEPPEEALVCLQHSDFLLERFTATANKTLQANAQQSKDKAAAEKDLSHATAKAGPFTLSSSGAPAQDNADRTQGQWDQTVGSAKETVGGLLGNDNLKQQGREQNLSGQGQEAKGQASDLGHGLSDRVQGSLGSAVSGLTGDKAGQQKYSEMHDEGKTRQRGVEMDLDKQAQAQQKY